MVGPTQKFPDLTMLLSHTPFFSLEQIHHLPCVTCVTLTPFSGNSCEKTVQEKDSEYDPQCDTSDTLLKIPFGQKDKKYLIWGKSHEEIVQEKDPGNRDHFVLLPGSVLPGISDPLVYFPGNPGRCALISGKSYEKMVQGKDPGYDPYVARVARNLKRGLDTMDTISGFSGKSHEKMVQENDLKVV